MPHGKRLTAAFLFAAMVASTARATITATLVKSAAQPTAGAIADAQQFDGVNLANYTTYDLNIVLSGSGVDSGQTVGDDWQSAQAIFHLNSGSFYIADLNLDPPPIAHGPVSFNRWNTAGNREYQFDTFLAAPTSFAAQPSIVKKFYPPTQQDQDPIWVTNEVNANWVDTNFNRNAVNGSTPFTIARFTILNGSTGFLYGQVFSQFGGGPVAISLGSTPFAPEPASLGLLGIAAGFMLRRPKRSATRA